jgi:hypothetical protein
LNSKKHKRKCKEELPQFKIIPHSILLLLKQVAEKIITLEVFGKRFPLRNNYTKYGSAKGAKGIVYIVWKRFSHGNLFI